MLELAQHGIDLKQRDVDRKTALVKSNFGSQLDLDNSATALVTAQRAGRSSSSSSVPPRSSQLLGNPDLPLEQFPPYAQAKAALDRPQRNLDHTVLRAPMAGIATQVDQIQLGRFVAAGTPVFSVIDVAKPWVDANPKETDFTYVAVGQPVTHRRRCVPRSCRSRAPSARSRPAPARNSRSCRRRTPPATSSRWCSACRCGSISITDDKFVQKLKAGMSAYASIDTGHRRSLAALLGFSPAAANQD